MIAACCALVSGLLFYFSIGLGEQWALAWIAPIPVLWLAFGATPLWRALLVAFVAYAIGGANYLPAYAGAIPTPVLALAIGAPALMFAVAVGGARFVYRRLGPAFAILAFAVLWTALDFIAAFNRAGGAGSTPAVNQIDAPVLVQSASLVGFAGVTFLLAAVSAALAVALRERKPVFALAAASLFAVNAGYGAWRMSAPSTGAIRVALIASNDIVGEVEGEDEAAALAAINAYAAEIANLRADAPELVVLPENIARLAPSWRQTAEAPLAAAARQLNATLVTGFNAEARGAQRNVAIAFMGEAPAVSYEKRRLVIGLETRIYTPGQGPIVLANGIGLEICKDMDFHDMIRADVATGRPLLLAVPAWDFDADGWAHARVAMMRSVENGVPLARSARYGWLTLNDRFGRVIARERVTTGFTTLVGQVPLHGRGGETLYSRIGDVFGWACLGLSLVLLVTAAFVRRRRAPA